MTCPSCGQPTLTAFAPVTIRRNDDLETFAAQSYYDEHPTRYLGPCFRCVCGNQDMRGRKKEPNRAIARALTPSRS